MCLFPGPPSLGRGIVVSARSPAPPAAGSWPRVTIDGASLERPSVLARRLHGYWIERRPVVVELELDPGSLREPERYEGPAWEVGAGFEFGRERLQYLVWSNNYDARTTPSAPIWWHARRALRLGASAGGTADVILPGGSEAFCDGGPRGPVAGSHLVLVHRESIEAGSLQPDRDEPVNALLAPDQLAAVAHRAGAARIIAPAGSGKTRVLTERLRHLLADRGVTPGSVLAVAFNRRAADELVERTAGLPAHIRTLNSLGLALVNGARPFAPTGEAQRRVIDETEVRRILERLVSVRRQVNTDPWVPYIDALSAIRLGLRNPAEVEEDIPDAARVAEIFDDYRQILADEGAVDFDEQIYGAIEILLRRPDVRKRAQAHARHLLVDEFQDLTPAHMLMLRLLAAPTYDVFGVGDDDQVIYSYAGASPEFLIGYDGYFPAAAFHALETNYRCPPAVVDSARLLLGFNRQRVRKTISSLDGEASDPAAMRVEARPVEEHAMAVMAEIDSWRATGARPEQMAVLSRVNASLLPVQVMLMESGVPTSTPLGPEVLGRTGIRAALSYLRIGADPTRIRRADIAETIRRPSRKIARNVTEMLLRRNTTSLEGVRSLAQALSGGDVEKLDAYADDLELVANLVRRDTTAAALRAIRCQIGLASAMEALDSTRRELDRSTHLDDLAALEQVALLHPNPLTFATWLHETLAARAAAGQDDVVTLSTVHRVKGREWPHVVVLGASEDLFPHRLAADTEEERRIFHVAITRCSSDVVIVADSLRPSRFCDELAGQGRIEYPSRHRPGSRGDPLSGLDRKGRVGARPPLGHREGEGPAPGPFDDGHARLLKALREWRREAAARDKVPAYVVLWDAYLEGIASRRPTTLAQLAACRGIGPVKLEKYGDEILVVIEGSLITTPS